MPILASDNRLAVRRMIWNALEWQPRALQLPVMMADNRFIAIAGGEGSGKSECCAMRAMEYLDISKLIWLCGDEFLDCRKEFEYMAEWGQQLGIIAPRDISFPSEGQCHFKTITGCHVYTVATKDVTKIGRESPDLIIMCEAARQSLVAYQRLRGRITREQGDLLLSGTYEGSLGWWPELVEKWSGYNVEDGKSFVMPTWANTAKYKLGNYQIVLTNGTIVKNVGKELHDLWYNSNTPPDICMERYAGRRVKPAGMVIPEFNIDYHVGDYPYNDKFPIDIAVDPGYGIPGAHAVLAIQMMEGGQIQVVDEMYLQHITTEEIIEKMQREKPWGKAFSDGAIDIAAKQHPAQPAVIEVWKKLTGVLLKCKKVTDVEAGVELLRGLMLPDRRTGFCKIVFNYSCYGIISELGGGLSPVIGGGPWVRNLQTNKPLDSNCHSTKALLYYCVSRLGYTIKKRESQYGKLLVPRGRQGRLVPLSEMEGKRYASKTIQR
jgi:hypothetical protein